METGVSNMAQLLAKHVGLIIFNDYSKSSAYYFKLKIWTTTGEIFQAKKWLKLELTRNQTLQFDSENEFKAFRWGPTKNRELELVKVLQHRGKVLSCRLFEPCTRSYDCLNLHLKLSYSVGAC